MNAPVRKPKMTLESFLAWEATVEERFEFVDGEVFAMTGGTDMHGRIISNLSGLFYNALRKHRCLHYVQTLKVVTPADNSYYPDIVVDCAPGGGKTNQVVGAPTVIVEVLSPSTEAFDRSHKRDDYLTLESLAHYVIVWQDETRVELWTREARGFHVETLTAPDETVALPALGPVTLTLADIYERVEFPPPPDASESLA